MAFNNKITPENKAKADNKGSKQNFSKSKYYSLPSNDWFANLWTPTTNPDPRPDWKMKDLDERNRPKSTKATKTAKSNNESAREAHAVKNNPNRASEFVTGKPKAKPKAKPTTTQTSSKSRPRTSSEIAAGIKSTPSKMPIASLSKSGNTMLMGSKEVETPSTFNTSAASNIAKAPNFAKMAGDGASVKEMRSTLKDYRKTVKGQVKEHKAAIKKQNKAPKFEKKISKIDNRANKAKR
jgi:hypothetical protein